MNHQLSNETKPDCLGYIGNTTIVLWGLNHYKDSGSLLNKQYNGKIWNVRGFFVAQLKSITRPLPTDGMCLHFFFFGRGRGEILMILFTPICEYIQKTCKTHHELDISLVTNSYFIVHVPGRFCFHISIPVNQRCCFSIWLEL